MVRIGLPERGGGMDEIIDETIELLIYGFINITRIKFETMSNFKWMCNEKMLNEMNVANVEHESLIIEWIYYAKLKLCRIENKC